jgi:putative hemolysin
MGGVGLEILLIGLLILANGVFAMAEIAVVSARKARLQQLAEAGDTRAREALALASSPNRFLAAIQVGISLVGILAGAFGGATIAESIDAALQSVPPLAPYGNAIGLGVVVVSITYFSLVLGELVPKRIGLSNAERIASLVAGPMVVVSRIARPVVRLLEASTNFVVWVLGVTPSQDPVISPEELKVLINQGTESGVFEEVEQEMLEGVLHLGDRTAGMLMTPRTRIVSLDVEDSLDAILDKLAVSHRSRFPVIQHDTDNVIGIVRAKDLLVQRLRHHDVNLRALAQPPLFVSETMPAPALLETLKRHGAHIALVTDEYGSIQGLVTHTDILESIVGEIPTRGETPHAGLVRREDGSWLVDGLLAIEELRDTIDLPPFPDEDDHAYHTVGGFVIHQLKSIPTAGQRFDWNRWRFEVIDMDGRRVDKVLVTPLTPAHDSPSGSGGEARGLGR